MVSRCAQPCVYVWGRCLCICVCGAEGSWPQAPGILGLSQREGSVPLFLVANEKETGSQEGPWVWMNKHPIKE